jgi:hypothetical protein
MARLLTSVTARGRAEEISDAALRNCDLAAALQALWHRPAKAPVQPTGADDVAALPAAHCR